MMYRTMAACAAPPRRHGGAALVVALVLMLVLTALGASTMSMATLELRMASNAEAHQDAFQAAETGIEIPIGRRRFSTQAPTILPETPIGDGSSNAQSVTSCVATTPVPDVAFSMGTTAASVQAFHFEVLSVGRGPRGAISTHKQGFYVLGPGGAIGCQCQRNDGRCRG